MGTAAPPLAAPGTARELVPSRLLDFLAREGLLVGTAALFVLFWSLAAPDALVADSWLTLLGGREIAAHGIPHHDSLAIISAGHPWIDQQWLAQLAYWGTYRVGGLRLDVFLTISLELAALLLAFVVARRRGGTGTTIVPFAIGPFFYFWSVMRAQAFSNLLFVALLVLLAAESRRQTRRVWLAFPLLLLWANVHGAVVVGVGLTALLGLCEAGSLVRARAHRGRAWLRPAALVAAPWLTLVATPWGLDTVGYYRSTLGNTLFRQFQGEWMPPQLLTLIGYGTFLLAGAAVFLVAKRGSELTAFELGALAVTLVGALSATRSAPWLAYTCLLFLPALAERARRRTEPGAPNRLRSVFALVLVLLAVGAAVAAAAAPERRLLKYWPPAQASAALDRVLRSDPHARVFASHEYADWLLFTKPSVRGRIAFDGRWEILTQSETRSVIQYLWQIGAQWERPARGYRLLVLNPQNEDRVVKTLDARKLRVLYRDSRVVVYDRVTTTRSSR